jgi:RNA polymerase sigma-70 factor (ECF subfamily)
MTQVRHELQPENWVDLHSDYMYYYTRGRISDDEMAKDLVQETFLSALKAMSNFQGKSNERTWLISILKRKIVDYYRKINSAKGKAEIKMNFYEEGENKGKWLEERVPQTWENEAERSMESAELKHVIDLCIEYLPEKYAIVFKMRTLQNIETDEICKELEITSSNLWVMIHRARTQLRKCLEDNWFNN